MENAQDASKYLEYEKSFIVNLFFHFISILQFSPLSNCKFFLLIKFTFFNVVKNVITMIVFQTVVSGVFCFFKCLFWIVNPARSID